MLLSDRHAWEYAELGNCGFGLVTITFGYRVNAFGEHRLVLASDGSGLADIDIPETPQGNTALLTLQGITQQEALTALTFT